MCEKANGLIWDAVCELLGRVRDLEGNLGMLDDAVDDEVLSREAADDFLSEAIILLKARVLALEGPA